MNKLTKRLTIALAVVMFVFVFVPVADIYAQTPPPPQTTVYEGDADNNPIWKWIQFFMNWLTILIVAGSSVMVAYAGIRYITSRDNPQGVQAAKEQIFNVLLGLLAYFFLFGFIQWLVPGGVF